MAVSKPLLTEFGIHHRLESCVIHIFLIYTFRYKFLAKRIDVLHEQYTKMKAEISMKPDRGLSLISDRWLFSQEHFLWNKSNRAFRLWSKTELAWSIPDSQKSLLVNTSPLCWKTISWGKVKEVEKKGMNAQATRSALKLNFIQLMHFFVKISLIGPEGKPMTQHQGDTVFSHSLLPRKASLFCKLWFEKLMTPPLKDVLLELFRWLILYFVCHLSLKITQFAWLNMQRYCHSVSFDQKLACITNYYI